MQKLMLARGNSEYAFRIIDRAEVPEDPVEAARDTHRRSRDGLRRDALGLCRADPGHGQEPHVRGVSDGGSSFWRVILTPMQQPIMGRAEFFIGSAIVRCLIRGTLSVTDSQAAIRA